MKTELRKEMEIKKALLNVELASTKIDSLQKAIENAVKLGQDALLKMLEDLTTIADKQSAVAYPPGHEEPEDGSRVYTLYSEGCSSVHHTYLKEDATYKARFARGNIFLREKDAERADRRRIAQHELIRLIVELNHREGWVADWENKKQNKGCFTRNHSKSTRMLQMIMHTTLQEVEDCYYFPPYLHEEIINTLGEAKIELALWGKE